MTNNDASNPLNGSATSLIQAQGSTLTADTGVTEDNRLKDSGGSILEPYSLYLYNNTILVYLRPITNLSFFEDHVASHSACTGADLTDPTNWIDACAYTEPSTLCWNVLEQKHEIIYRSEQLTKLDGINDGSIPFDHATGQLRAVQAIWKSLF